ncbi:MAG: hypothetical protein CME24_05570 [Gemmatimonadetes bacterium]|nr:hypothetical protein [Gemmatimonadota bacterium]
MKTDLEAHKDCRCHPYPYQGFHTELDLPVSVLMGLIGILALPMHESSDQGAEEDVDHADTDDVQISAKPWEFELIDVHDEQYKSDIDEVGRPKRAGET